MRGRTFSCSLLYPSNYQNVHCGHLLCRPQNIFCQLHYCLAGGVDVGIWLIFFQNLISFNHFLQFLWYELEIFCTFADRRCKSIHARGCLCVALFNILRCFSSFDRLLVVVWRLYTSYPETRLATFLQSSSNLPPLFLHSFTIKPLDLHWSNTGLTLEQHCSYSYPTFVLRQMPMRYSVTALQWNPRPIKIWKYKLFIYINIYIYIYK